MERIKPLARDKAHPDAQAFYDRDEQIFGMVLNTTQVMAYRPSVLAAAKALGQSVAKNGVLSPELRALVCVRVAMLVGCPF